MPSLCKDSECSHIKINWLAMGSIVALLALVFSVIGWLFSGVSISAKNSVRLQNLETQHAKMGDRLDKVDAKLDQFGVSLGRIEQEILDMRTLSDPPKNKAFARSLKKPAVKNDAFADSLKTPAKPDVSTSAQKK